MKTPSSPSKNLISCLFKKLKKNLHCKIKKIYIQKGNLFPLLLLKTLKKIHISKKYIQKGNQFPLLFILKNKKNSHSKKNIQKGNPFPFLLTPLRDLLKIFHAKFGI